MPYTDHKFKRGERNYGNAGFVNKAECASLEQMFDFAFEMLAYEEPVEPVPWISENFIDPISGALVQLEEYQARILGEALRQRTDGSSEYNLVVWSQPKKSGKTAIAGAVGAYVASNIESPNDICTVANDQEQSAGRIFAAMLPTLERLGARVPSTVSARPHVGLKTGTTIRAITTRYEGEAGANPGLTLWSELWAFSGERLQRLWEEMTPPPTRKFRMRWVETYAGFKGESELLWQLYSHVFKDETETELQPGVYKLWDDLPVYTVEALRALVFWDHEHRMVWQTPDYYAAQRADLRPSAYSRLHGNSWVANEDSFITAAMWRVAAVLEDMPSAAEARGSTFALDGAKDGDCYSLVGVRRVKEMIKLTHVRTWEPHGVEVDQSDVENEVLRLYKEGTLKTLHYDPYQLVGMAQRLREAGVKCEEFTQMSARTKSDTFLYRLFNEGRIQVWPDELLSEHVKQAKAKELDGQRMRIVKPKAGDEDQRKVDGAVALSMAAYKAWTAPTGGWAM